MAKKENGKNSSSKNGTLGPALDGHAESARVRAVRAGEVAVRARRAPARRGGPRVLRRVVLRRAAAGLAPVVRSGLRGAPAPEKVRVKKKVSYSAHGTRGDNAERPLAGLIGGTRAANGRVGTPALHRYDMLEVAIFGFPVSGDVDWHHLLERIPEVLLRLLVWFWKRKVIVVV